MTHSDRRPAPPDAGQQQALGHLLETMDADADPVHRHLWLIGLMDWIRGDGNSADAAVARVGLLITAVDANPATAIRLQVWWQTLIDTVDGTTLLSDYGFASRNAFVSEFVERLHYKLLPVSPETTPILRP